MSADTELKLRLLDFTDDDLPTEPNLGDVRDRGRRGLRRRRAWFVAGALAIAVVVGAASVMAIAPQDNATVASRPRIVPGDIWYNQTYEQCIAAEHITAERNPGANDPRDVVAVFDRATGTPIEMNLAQYCSEMAALTPEPRGDLVAAGFGVSNGHVVTAYTRNGEPVSLDEAQRIIAAQREVARVRSANQGPAGFRPLPNDFEIVIGEALTEGRWRAAVREDADQVCLLLQFKHPVANPDLRNCAARRAVGQPRSVVLSRGADGSAIAITSPDVACLRISALERGVVLTFSAVEPRRQAAQYFVAPELSLPFSGVEFAPC